MIFSAKDFDDHEEVVFVSEPLSGLRAIIAVHNTKLGPALGGCRMYPYTSEAEAISDVLRLSRGMSYKSAIAGVALGGGKSVIIGDPSRDKTEALLRAMGRAVDRLGGRYIVGEDIGTNPVDMKVMRSETPTVSCLEVEDGGYGDPAPLTALGVYEAMRAARLFREGAADIAGLSIAVQGVGNVGSNLCRLIHENGGSLIVCDSNPGAAERMAGLYGAQVVAAEEIYDADAAIFAPCAIGGTLNHQTACRLKAQIVAGAANNQLSDPAVADLLCKRRITYVPDYVANGGGIMSCAAEWYGTDPAEIEGKVRGIFSTSLELLRLAEREGISPAAAADALAQQRLGLTQASDAQLERLAHAG